MAELKNERFECEPLKEIDRILRLQGCRCEPLPKNTAVLLASLQYDGWGIELIGWSMYLTERKGYICYKEVDKCRLIKKIPFGRIPPNAFETKDQLKADMRTALDRFMQEQAEKEIYREE